MAPAVAWRLQSWYYHIVLLRDIIFPKHKEKTLLVAQDKKGAPFKKIREMLLLLIVGGLVLLVITIIHIKKTGVRLEEHITEAANRGFENIVQGARALQLKNWQTADQLFKEAKSTFSSIDNKTWFSSNPYYKNLRNPISETGNAVIQGGKNLAEAGELFTAVAHDLHSLPTEFFEAQKSLSLVTRPSLTEKLKRTIPSIHAATKALEQAHESFENISGNFIPTELRSRFESAKNAMGTLIALMKIFQEDMPALLVLLGDTEPHTYLILLQNNQELRPTGGFIGNYMILETNDGYLTKREVFDVYSADQQLNEIVSPPEEILPVNQRWFLRDSNYSAHFPLSAEKAAWFLEKEKGPGVDTVISIDQSLIEKLLELTGPIKIPELREPLTSKNFSLVLSYVTEAKLAGRENPKAIVHSFIQAFQKKVFSEVDPAELLFVLRAQMQSKHLFAYSKDPTVQAFFERHKVAGLMKKLEAKEDYLSVVHTSIGGNKSDAYVAETIHHDTYLHSDGSVLDEVTITRTHHWDSATEKGVTDLLSSFGFSSISKNIMEILGRSRNLHALRLYVPKGTVLEKNLEKKNATAVTTVQDEETEKTYFSVRMEVPVGETRSLTLRYLLPFKLTLSPVDTYTLTIQKQAGQDGVTFQKRIFPESRVLNYKYFPAEGTFDADGVWNYETELTEDTSLLSVWGK